MRTKLEILRNQVRNQGKIISRYNRKGIVECPGRPCGQRITDGDRKLLDSLYEADRLMQSQGFKARSIANLVIAIAEGLLSPDSVNLHYIACVGQNTEGQDHGWFQVLQQDQGYFGVRNRSKWSCRGRGMFARTRRTGAGVQRSYDSREHSTNELLVPFDHNCETSHGFSGAS